jgi:hypothetical protein
MSLIQIAHSLAAFIVLAEALNKLERCAPLAPGLTPHARVVDGLKALAWVLLAVGAAGALATPVLSSLGINPSPWDAVSHTTPSTAETAVLVGFAVLIVRTRVKEG